MGLLDNYKKKKLDKQITKSNLSRVILISPLKDYHNILIVLNDTREEKEIKNHLSLIFENAKYTTLAQRNDKTDDSSGYFYSFHPSDMGLTKIKNDRLIGLINTNFDLIIDFVSESTALDYFVHKSNSSLKIGDLHSSKNYLYDLLVENGTSTSNFIKNIKIHITLLSKNGNN